MITSCYIDLPLCPLLTSTHVVRRGPHQPFSPSGIVSIYTPPLPLERALTTFCLTAVSRPTSFPSSLGGASCEAKQNASVCMSMFRCCGSDQSGTSSLWRCSIPCASCQTNQQQQEQSPGRDSPSLKPRVFMTCASARPSDLPCLGHGPEDPSSKKKSTAAHRPFARKYRKDHMNRDPCSAFDSI